MCDMTSARKVLLTGGVRSGKSRRAQTRAESLAPQRVLIATAQPLDDEMAQRIARHQQERKDGWRVIEAPIDVGPHLEAGPVVVLDCLTLWLSNLLMRELSDEAIERASEGLCAAIERSTSHVLCVTNEVGFGVVPPTPLGRRFRDLAGGLAQRVAAVSDEVELMCAGLAVRLKG